MWNSSSLSGNETVEVQIGTKERIRDAEKIDANDQSGASYR